MSSLGHLNINERQMRLIEYFIEKPGSYTNFGIHMQYYGISKSSSLNDLRELVQKGYIKKINSGRNTHYVSAENLTELATKK